MPDRFQLPPRGPKRTIPDEAWPSAGCAVFRDGRLYPDTSTLLDVNDRGDYPDSDDEDAIHWLSYFTLENYAEWAGGVVLCPRAPSLEKTLVRFDPAPAFAAHGYRNPYREPGVPDWYFFWTRHHRMGELKRWARDAGLLPAKDLPIGGSGYGFNTGLAAEMRGEIG